MESGKLTFEEFKEIESLVNKAVNAWNKKDAEPHIKRLTFMRNILNIEPYKSVVLGELIAHATSASGQVRDKNHWLDAVNQSLYKLEPSTNNEGEQK